jgi:hypothetical protein
MLDTTQNRRDALNEMARDQVSRSYTAQIRELYDAIENALASGVSRTAIHQKLVDTGMNISLRNFDQALYRIRKSEKKKAIPKNSAVTDKARGAESMPAARKVEPIKEEKPKEKVSFRQNLKDIRKNVENTNWADLISE